MSGACSIVISSPEYVTKNKKRLLFSLHLESQADQTDEKSQKMHAQWMARNLAVELLVLHTAPSCLAQKHAMFS